MTADRPTWRLAMVSGHRPQHLDRRSFVWVDAELRRIAWKLRFEHGTETMLSGMAAGVDLWWGSWVEHVQAALAAHVPFPQQPDPWRDPAVVARYHELLAYAERTGGVKVYGNLLTDLSPERRKAQATRLLFARNQGMLDTTAAADGVVVAVLRSAHAGGGTRDTYDKAMKMGLPVIRVDPDLQKTILASRGRQTTEPEQETLLPI